QDPDGEGPALLAAAAGAGEPEVAIRDGQLYGRRLARPARAVPAPEGTQPGQVARPAGTVLVTGGARGRGARTGPRPGPPGGAGRGVRAGLPVRPGSAGGSGAGRGPGPRRHRGPGAGRGPGLSWGGGRGDRGGGAGRAVVGGDPRGRGDR